MSRRRGVFRSRNVAPTDARSPMLRLLQDGRCAAQPDGRVMVAVLYDAQWRTLWRAQRLGLLDKDQFLTDAGRKFLTDNQKGE